MMNIFKFYKQAFSIMLLSLLFIGCSSKSTKSNLGNNPSTIDENGTNTLDVDTTNTQEGNETSGLENEPNTCKDGEEKGISRSYTDTDGDGTIDIVRIYTYDSETGNLLSIAVYVNVNGEREPEKNGMTPIETVTYSYDTNGYRTGITKDKDGNVVQGTPSEPINETPSNPTITDNLVDGTGDIVTTDSAGTTRTFTYENMVLVIGKAEYQNGNTKEYIYGYDENGNRITETVTHKNKDGQIVDTETISYDNMGNVLQVGHDTNGDGEFDSSSSTEYEYICV